MRHGSKIVSLIMKMGVQIPSKNYLQGGVLFWGNKPILHLLLWTKADSDSLSSFDLLVRPGPVSPWIRKPQFTAQLSRDIITGNSVLHSVHPATVRCFWNLKQLPRNAFVKGNCQKIHDIFKFIQSCIGVCGFLVHGIFVILEFLFCQHVPERSFQKCDKITYFITYGLKSRHPQVEG